MESLDKNHPHNHSVHKILAHSYLVYFTLFLAGVALDLVFKFKIFSSTAWMSVGVLLLFFATLLIFWAQHTSRHLDIVNLRKETFCKGPYCYTRSPTHWGLFFLMLGFGLIINAVFVILSTLISFLITRFVFLERQERRLADKYGAPYVEYQKAVKL